MDSTAFTTLFIHWNACMYSIVYCWWNVTWYIHTYTNRCCLYWSIQAICWSAHITDYTIHIQREIGVINYPSIFPTIVRGIVCVKLFTPLTHSRGTAQLKIYLSSFGFLLIICKWTILIYLFICTPRLLLSSDNHSFILQYSDWEHCYPSLVYKWWWLYGRHRGDKVFCVMTTPTDLYETINGTTDEY